MSNRQIGVTGLSQLRGGSEGFATHPPLGTFGREIDPQSSDRDHDRQRDGEPKIDPMEPSNLLIASVVAHLGTSPPGTRVLPGHESIDIHDVLYRRRWSGGDVKVKDEGSRF